MRFDSRQNVFPRSSSLSLLLLNSFRNPTLRTISCCVFVLLLLPILFGILPIIFLPTTLTMIRSKSTLPISRRRSVAPIRPIVACPVRLLSSSSPIPAVGIALLLFTWSQVLIPRPLILVLFLRRANKTSQVLVPESSQESSLRFQSTHSRTCQRQ